MKTQADKKAYMRAYYLAHPEKWTKHRKGPQRIKRSEEELREAKRIRQQRWRDRHPGKGTIAGRMARGAPEPTRPCPIACECCGGPPNGGQGLNLDHCHKTNTFRGWLCMRCNTAIGKLGDDLMGAWKALNYLSRADSTAG